jgi:hypothetical protein
MGLFKAGKGKTIHAGSTMKLFEAPGGIIPKTGFPTIRLCRLNNMKNEGRNSSRSTELCRLVFLALAFAG